MSHAAEANLPQRTDAEPPQGTTSLSAGPPLEAHPLGFLIPDRVYFTTTLSLKGSRFLDTSHEAVKAQVEAPLSARLHAPVDVKEWKDWSQPIVTPGLAVGYDIDPAFELFYEFSYGAADLKTRGQSAHSYLLEGTPWVDTGRASYKFNIRRESTTVGVGPLVHIGDLLEKLKDTEIAWMGREAFDPYFLTVLTYNWSSSDFDANVRFAGGDVSSQLGLPDGSAIVPVTTQVARTHNTGRGPGLSVGGGFNLPLSQHVGLTTTARYNFVHLDGRGGVDFDLDQWTAALGIVVQLGD